MHQTVKIFAMTVALSLASGTLHAQGISQDFAKITNFSIDGIKIQMHGFASQGFALSNDNNYLTMKTSKGSFEFTDGGINLAATITDRFRIAAQVYDSDIGALGAGHVNFDWGYADYKFKDWFGLRGGKVKTALGLFNDTQDMEFLHTWAILPQGTYPIDLRSSVIAHTGGDVYGDIGLRKAGSLSYTGYVGIREDDRFGGQYYGLVAAGDPIRTFGGTTGGFDLRWHSPVPGLVVGVSWAKQTEDLVAIIIRYGNAPLVSHASPEHITSGFGEYTHGPWNFSGEFRRDYNISTYTVLGSAGSSNQSSKSWFLTAAYRVNKWLELGTYHSRFYADNPATPADQASNHIFDQTVTMRFDIRSWLDFKLEGHFIDGYGDTYSSHGFYSSDNPAGLKPKTDMLVARIGANF